MGISFVNENGVGYGSPLTSGLMPETGFKLDAIPKPIEPITGKPQALQNKEEKTTVDESAINEEKANAEQKELWAREDAIRKETQEREDNINQRMVEDMRKAGMNPNLISGASAVGGGISSGTAKNLDRIENAKSRALELLKQEIQNSWAGNQKDLDRITSIINSVIKII